MEKSNSVGRIHLTLCLAVLGFPLSAIGEGDREDEVNLLVFSAFAAAASTRRLH
jgi:hypothetical protein